MTDFGATFKKARESKGISLDQIAAETRISTRFLSAIENEEFHLLPGGIFNRGFVRAFAEKLGLDSDQAVADYEQIAQVQKSNELFAATETHADGAPRALYRISMGLLALVIVIFYVVTRESGPPITTDRPAVTLPYLAPPEPLTRTATERTPAHILRYEDQESVTVRSQALTVDIEAREKTWIRVTTDGSSINQGEILEPGMTRTFTAQGSIDMSIGNAGGLTMKINEQSARPLGRSGQVRIVTITPHNVEDFIG